jgi:hypothetical protein
MTAFSLINQGCVAARCSSIVINSWPLSKSYPSSKILAQSPRTPHFQIDKYDKYKNALTRIVAAQCG